MFYMIYLSIWAVIALSYFGTRERGEVYQPVTAQWDDVRARDFVWD
jgi:hypothetical protein